MTLDFDLDEVLGTTPPKEHLPETFEEWCEIHGEPEYLGESVPCWNKDILVEHCDPEEIQCDTSGILYRDKKDVLQINYKAFVDAFATINNCVFCNGVFYTPDGELDAQTIRRDIANSLGDAGLTTRLDVPTKAIHTMLQDMYSVDELPIDEKVIPLANGDLHLGKDEWVFRLGEKKHAPYRLSVNYNPVDKPTPLFDKWLHDAFDPEDILTIQEIMGYCLVPSTAAAEAFIIVGDAEAGKSGFGTILLGLLGSAATSMETQDLLTKRFQIATVENKLVAYDDDLGSAALTDTNLFKKLITADTPIRAERKYADPHEFMSYCRIVASANFMLSSLYDDSDGFFRRLHPIYIKPKQPDRKVIRNFYETILEEEKEQILKWALVGLRRVIANGWRISWSQRSIEYMKKAKSNACHFGDFLTEACEVVEGYDVTTAEITNVYRRWCKENGVKEMSERRLAAWLSDNADTVRIVQSNKIKRTGKRLRGYQNLKIRDEWKNLVVI